MLMQYLLMIYSREDDSVSPTEMQQVSATHAALIEEASRRGIFRGGNPLASSSTATTVRVDSGKVLLTDGPFIETKEQLAGYYLLDCQDLDEAIEFAARIPTTCCGAPGFVEVRPLRTIKPRLVDE